jgi:serine/threonine protein kinase
MVQALCTGTLLRQRYLIQRLLGQGGFGRTYLAIDQERFNETCVIKEFAMSNEDERVVRKAKSLFQREASILYQVQHPQIPRFTASFEDGDHLFLVQTYVPGQTYGQTLRQRLALGRTFTPIEVVHLLTALLPVLDYLHQREILHRDISPDNIIAPDRLIAPDRFTPDRFTPDRFTPDRFTPDRDRPNAPTSDATVLGPFASDATNSGYAPSGPMGTDRGLPVLIDFGAVKAAATSATQLGKPFAPNTRVGKRGYAPPEQLQTGQVNPTSDLYALAATCAVLLTGQRPSQLLTPSLQWQVEALVGLGPKMSQILLRMLAPQPKERFASAQAVLAAIAAVPPADRTLNLEPTIPNLDETTTNLWAPSLNQASLIDQGFPVDQTLQPNPGSLAIQDSAHLSTHPATFTMPLTQRSPSRPTRAPQLPAFAPTPSQIRPPYQGSEPRQPLLIQALLVLSVLGTLGWNAPQVFHKLNAQNEQSAEVWLAGTKVNPADIQQLQDGQTQPLSHFALRESAANALGNPEQLRALPAQRLQISPAYPAKVQSQIEPQTLQPYRFTAKRGEVVTITLKGMGVVMNIAQPNPVGTSEAPAPLSGSAYQTRSWTGQIAKDGDYAIQVFGSGSYTLELMVTPTPKPQGP